MIAFSSCDPKSDAIQDHNHQASILNDYDKLREDFSFRISSALRSQEFRVVAEKDKSSFDGYYQVGSLKLTPKDYILEDGGINKELLLADLKRGGCETQMIEEVLPVFDTFINLLIDKEIAPKVAMKQAIEREVVLLNHKILSNKTLPVLAQIDVTMEQALVSYQSITFDGGKPSRLQIALSDCKQDRDLAYRKLKTEVGFEALFGICGALLAGPYVAAGIAITAHATVARYAICCKRAYRDYGK